MLLSFFRRLIKPGNQGKLSRDTTPPGGDNDVHRGDSVGEDTPRLGFHA